MSGWTSDQRRKRGKEGREEGRVGGRGERDSERGRWVGGRNIPLYFFSCRTAIHEKDFKR